MRVAPLLVALALAAAGPAALAAKGDAATVSAFLTAGSDPRANAALRVRALEERLGVDLDGGASGGGGHADAAGFPVGAAVGPCPDSTCETGVIPRAQSFVAVLHPVGPGTFRLESTTGSFTDGCSTLCSLTVSSAVPFQVVGKRTSGTGAFHFDWGYLA